MLPAGWTLAEPLHRDDLLGFSYGVFQRPSREIVLAYAGTNEGIDWASDLIASAGIAPAPQLVAAEKSGSDSNFGNDVSVWIGRHPGAVTAEVATDAGHMADAGHCSRGTKDTNLNLQGQIWANFPPGKAPRFDAPPGST